MSTDPGGWYGKRIRNENAASKVTAVKHQLSSIAGALERLTGLEPVRLSPNSTGAQARSIVVSAVP